MQYLVLSIGIIIFMGLAGAVFMMSIFGTGAIVNKNGSLSGQQKNIFSRCLVVSLSTALFFTVTLIFLIVGKPEYYSHWYLILPIWVNLVCVKRLLSTV